ncbi:lipoprotein [Mycoplasma mycoides]|nr:lipoprotein [Mycoplasma mycoides]ACU78550.1 prolipoprotein, putative (VlcJ) [Mycoplasma mycoides subsp. capri str. GM12]ACU79381.1 prolipoprotein, putative (VlcJ) [Mycoplasma mycoides subsp. capri str. GM12]
MKKLLTILGSVGLVATTSAAVIACGDKSQQKAPDKKDEKKDIEKSKKEEEKDKDSEKEKTPEKEEKMNSMFPKQNLDLGAFFKYDNKNNSFSQLEIKQKIAELSNVHISTLTDLNITYEKDSGEGTVRSTKYSDTLKFKFSNTLDLGEFQKETNGTVPQAKVKKKLSETLKQSEKDLVGLEVKYEEKTGSGTVKSNKKMGTISFKFTIKEQNKK